MSWKLRKVELWFRRRGSNIPFIDCWACIALRLQSPVILFLPRGSYYCLHFTNEEAGSWRLGNPTGTQLLVLLLHALPQCRPHSTSHAPAMSKARIVLRVVKPHGYLLAACGQPYWYSKHLMPFLEGDLFPCPTGSNLGYETWFCKRNMSRRDVWHF